MPVPESLSQWADELKAQGADPSVVDALIKDIESKEKAAEFAKGSVLRQQDYDRNLNRLKEEQQKKLADLEKQFKDTTEAWNVSKAAYDEQTERMKKAQEEAASNPSAEDGSGASDQIEDEDTKRLAALFNDFKTKVITKEDLAKFKDEVSQDMTQKFWKEAYPQTLNAAVLQSDLAIRHQQEFGEPLNRNDFEKYVKESGVTFPNVENAYDWFVHGKREDKKRSADQKKELETAVQRAREEERARLLQKSSSVPGTFPQSGTGTPWLDKSKGIDEAAAKKLEGVKFDHQGKNQLARAMMEDLLKQGKYIPTTGLESLTD